MARIAIVGAGLGGLPAAYELRHLLPRHHQVILIGDRAQFVFIPSLPWVAFGLTDLASIQVDLPQRLAQRGIDWKLGRVTELDPHRQQVVLEDGESIAYDYLVIAPGAELDLQAVPGLGPERGYTQSVCSPHHALLARDAWQQFLQAPGPLVVGAIPGAGCFGPAYEFLLLADYELRKRGLRSRVPMTFVTPEPYAGHLGIGGMANSARLVEQMLAAREVEVIENAAIIAIEPECLHLADGRTLPFAYSMLLPPFRGARFLREIPGFANPQGFVPVLPTQQHPNYPSIYAVGVAVQLDSPEKTPHPLGVPKTGQMTEAMAMAAARNIAVQLGELSARSVASILEAICFADFGDTGIVFLAAPVLPEPTTGQRRRAIALQGSWVCWAKKAFEQYFLAKMRWGAAVPWFERLALKGAGLSLIEPVEMPPKTHSTSSIPANLS